MKRVVIDSISKFTLCFRIILIILVSVFLLGVFAAEAEANIDVSSSLRVKVEVPNYNSLSVRTVSHFGLFGEYEDWSEFDFILEGPITVGVPNPTERYSEMVEWELITNYQNVVLTFSSIGYDHEDYGSLTEPNINEFVNYSVFYSEPINDPDIFGSFRPGGSLTDINFERGFFEIAYDPELSEKLWCANRAGQYRDIIVVTIAGDPYFDGEETAFGGDSPGGGAAWWYYYDTEIGGEQTIWAGQHMNAGTVIYQNGRIEINLASGWELLNDNEPVKVQGYNENDLPSERQPAGQFEYKNYYFDNDTIVVNVANYDYYVIHLDLVRY